ncbi:MAG TPA: efflux RND transporter periplasmic adaptor subunit [Gemmataceae bacterium]|jgi:HlyD family secretion protein
MRKLLVVLVGLTAVLAGFAAWVSHNPMSAETGEGYVLAPVEYGTLFDPISATGIVQPRELFTVGTELAGKVVEVVADRNHIVAEGDVLLRLDDTLAIENRTKAERAIAAAKAQWEGAMSTLAAAKTYRQKIQDLPESVGLRKELDSAQYQEQSARANVHAAEVQIEIAEDGYRMAGLAVNRCTVRVPVLETPSPGQESRAGVGRLAAEGSQSTSKRTFVVLDRKVSLNQQIGPPVSAQLFTLAEDLAHVRVHAQVAEGDIGKVRAKMDARFTVSAYSDSENQFTGIVGEIHWLPTSQHGAVFYEVIIDADNQRDPVSGEWMLKPGMTASVDLVTRKREHVCKMPAAALNLQLDDSQISKEAKTKLESGQEKYPADPWRPVWILGADQKPWPIFVRVASPGSTNGGGSDEQFEQVLEWEAELSPKPDVHHPARLPRVIIRAPVPANNEFFKLPKVKL